ncbi:MAG: TetR/AcrR family transcriptional regulator [Usitatibacter sp.]
MKKRGSPSPPKQAEDLGRHFARAAVLGASVGVFTRLGLDATRIEDLLEAASISRRTFYKYFRSKDDVLAALYEEATGQLVNLVRLAQQDSGPSIAALRKGIDLYLDFHLENARVLRALVERAVQSDSPLAARRRWLQEQLVQLADETARATTHRALDPFVFQALIGALEGLSLHLLSSAVNAASIGRAKAVLHALLDHAIGVPRPAPFPTRR